MTRLFRARINPTYADVSLSPLEDGVRLQVGTLHIPLTSRDAYALANAIADQLGTQANHG